MALKSAPTVPILIVSPTTALLMLDMSYRDARPCTSLAALEDGDEEISRVPRWTLVRARHRSSTPPDPMPQAIASHRLPPSATSNMSAPDPDTIEALSRGSHAPLSERTCASSAKSILAPTVLFGAIRLSLALLPTPAHRLAGPRGVLPAAPSRARCRDTPPLQRLKVRDRSPLSFPYPWSPRDRMCAARTARMVYAGATRRILRRSLHEHHRTFRNRSRRSISYRNDTHTYCAARGDTLWMIARQNGTSVDALMHSNPEIVNADIIYPDQVIQLPVGQDQSTPSNAVVTQPDDPAPVAASPDLWLGSRGPAVSDLQLQLLGAGFDPGPVDGWFGPRTQAAVREFQSSRGLDIDGWVGPQTWSALGTSVSGTGDADGSATPAGPTATTTAPRVDNAKVQNRVGLRCRAVGGTVRRRR